MAIAVAATGVALTWGDWKAVALAVFWGLWCVVEDLVVLRRTEAVSSALDAQLKELKADMMDRITRINNRLGVK
jgi:hypothetical protein